MDESSPRDRLRLPLARDNIYANRYTDTTSRADCGFFKLMLVWKGSVLKLLWVDVVVYLVSYFTLTALYRLVFLHEDRHREIFEAICIYSARFSKLIPVSFMAGFYVANVVSRYWDQFLSLPWPDQIAYKLLTYIPGKDDYSRGIRRTVMRYLNLSTVLVFRLVSAKVLGRFPSWCSLIKTGLVLPSEADRLAAVDLLTDHETTWTPMLWVHDLLGKERRAGRLTLEPPVFANLVASFEYIYNCNRKIFNHGWVNFPLAYTQVVTVTVYAYLFASLFANQGLDPRGDHLDRTTFPTTNITFSKQGVYANHTPVVYFPWFALLELVGYLGWIKVAETLLNPWGDDDEDFQINYLIDRNFQTSFLIVDDAVPDTFYKEELRAALTLNMDWSRTPSLERKFDFPEVASQCDPKLSHKRPSMSRVQIQDQSTGNRLRKMSNIMKPFANFGSFVAKTGSASTSLDTPSETSQVLNSARRV